MGLTKQQDLYNGFDELIDLATKNGFADEANQLRIIRDNLGFDEEDFEAYAIQEPTGKEFPQNQPTDKLVEIAISLKNLKSPDTKDTEELVAVAKELENRRYETPRKTFEVHSYAELSVLVDTETEEEALSLGYHKTITILESTPIAWHSMESKYAEEQ